MSLVYLIAPFPSPITKPSVVVRPNPVLFQIPKSVQEESKENPSALPYRSIFAVLTLDSVLIYDTHHDQPLAVARGLHYAGLTDCCWSHDGLHLMVCSTDGYLSIISFKDGELGQVYTPPAVLCTSTEPEPSDVKNSMDVAPQPTMIVPTAERPQIIPPCHPGQAAVLEAPPTKRAKTRVTPTLVSTSLGPFKIQETPAKRSFASETDQVGDAVNKLTLGSSTSLEPANCMPSTDAKPAKKMKRIQPILVSK